MAEKDRGDLIREHGERIATLEERIENLRRDFIHIQKDLDKQANRRSSWNQTLVSVLGGILGGLLAVLLAYLLPRFLR